MLFPLYLSCKGKRLKTKGFLIDNLLKITRQKNRSEVLRM